MPRDLFRLDKKVAVVVGGTGGIGKYICKAYAEYGAKVAIAGRAMDRAKSIIEWIKKDVEDAEVESFYVDVTNEESVRQLADSVLDRFGTVDILVNAHGINIKMPATEIEIGKWEELFDVNVRGVMLTCREFGKIMIQKRSGKVINTSSVRGVRATKWPGNVGYCATKAAVDMITKQLAAEWAPYGVNVNAVAPALVAGTGAAKPTESNPERLKMYIESVPLRRIATVDDLIGVYIFLASPASDFITGQIIYVDGGLLAIG